MKSELPLTIRNDDIPLLLLNLLLLLLTVCTLFFANRHFLNQVRVKTLQNNSFLTTEWRLLQEMKTRTDRLLAEKDREIAELRSRYEMLQLRNSSEAVLAALEEDIRRAEAERADILSIRFTSTASPEAASDVSKQLDALAEKSLVSAPSTTDSLIVGDSPVVQLLRSRINSLELETEAENADVLLLEDELAALRYQLNALQSTPAVTESVEVPSGVDPDTILEVLEYDRSTLVKLEPVLSVTDVRTRSLLRAIVRTPVIRSEYPDLADSLDRYFELYGDAERIRGKQEGYDEVIETIKGMREP